MSMSKSMDGIALDFKSSTGRSLQRQPKFTIISCRATKFDTRKKTDLYKVLSLESEAVGFDEIKKAYRYMARLYHPDVCPPSRKEESTQMFVELRRAYETLSDPVLRSRYDSELRMTGSEMRVSSVYPREKWESQLSKLCKYSDSRETAGSAGRA